MKVLQIVPSISLVYGGPSQMVRGLSSALAQEGVEVTVLTTDSNGDIDQPPLAVPLNEPVKEEGYWVWYFRCSPFRRYKFSLSLLQWLAQYAPFYDIAHIHALFSPISTAAATVARVRGLPYILRPLGTLDPADLRKKRWLKQIYGTLLERPNLAGAAALHFTSHQEARVSERFGLHPPDLVIPLGVTQEQDETIKPKNRQEARERVRSHLNLAGDQPIVLFMSRIDPKKGLDLLLPALEALTSQDLEFHFVLSGSNPQDRAYEQTIHRRIEASALAHRTSITGFVSGDLKAALLQAADLFVLPSYYENFGIAVAEAMAVGTPVVISDQVHIWEEVQQSQSGWVSTCEVTSLTEALRQALLSSTKRQQCGQNAQNHALRHYSWPAIARQTIHAYEQILASHPKSS